MQPDFLQTLRDLRKKYGDIYSLSLGKFWVVVVNGSENLRELLVKHAESTTDRPPFYMFQISNNKGVISSSGSEWKHQRTFALSKLRDFGFGKRSFESRILEELEIFLSLLNSYEGQPFDISDILQTSMSNNVMSIAVGRRFDYDDAKFKHFVHLLEENITHAAATGPMNFVPLLAKLPGDLFSGQLLQRNADLTFDFFRNEIKEHKQTLDDNNIRDFIDGYLVQIKEQPSGSNIYTEEQLLYIIGDLFAAGTETTATTIRWAMIYLMNNMDIQRKMKKEIEDVVGDGRLPCLSDKPNLPYCEAVMHESLRLGNIVPFSLPHYVTNDIFHKGYKIPKNSVIIPSLDSVAYDEKLFPDSHVFNPERFLDANGKVCGQDKVLTFSLGRRVCLGESLARMELFLYMTALIQRFEFQPPVDEKPPPVKGNLGLTYAPIKYTLRAMTRR